MIQSNHWRTMDEILDYFDGMSVEEQLRSRRISTVSLFETPSKSLPLLHGILSPPLESLFYAPGKNSSLHIRMNPMFSREPEIMVSTLGHELCHTFEFGIDFKTPWANHKFPYLEDLEAFCDMFAFQWMDRGDNFSDAALLLSSFTANNTNSIQIY